MATGTDIYSIELVDRVSSRAVRASMSVSRLTNSLDRVGRSGALAQLALNSAASAIGNLGAMAISRGIGAMASLGASIADTARFASRAKFSLRTLYGGVAEGAAAQEKAVALSNKYGLSLDLVLESMQRFKGVGFSSAQSESLIQLGADLKATGRSAEQIDSIFRTLGQMRGAALKAEEINQLRDAGVAVAPIYDVLAKRLGIVDKAGKTAREQLEDLQRAGKIPGDLGIAAFNESVLRALGKTKFGEAGEEFANQTIDGAIDRLKANLGNALFKAAQAAEPELAAGFQALTKGITGVDTSNLQDALTESLKAVGKGLQDLGPKIPGFIASLGKLAAALERLAPLLEATLSPTRGAAKALGFTAPIGPQPAAPGNDQGFMGWLARVTGIRDEVMAARKAAGVEAAFLDGNGRAPTEVVDFGGPLNDLAFSAATESFDGTIDAADRAALAAPSSGIRTQVVEAAAAVAAGTPGAGKKVDVGSVNVNINLAGGGDPMQNADAIRQWADTEFGATLERQLEGTGD